MKHYNKMALFSNGFTKATIVLLTFSIISCCSTKISKEKNKSENPTPKTAPESLSFISHIITQYDDGTKSEFDTLSGYRKYYYKIGKLQMEGKVTKSSPKDFRDGIWNYYNEDGQLMKQETYFKEGKLNQFDFMYFTNGKPLSKTYQYFEGNYKDKSTFKFHKIETLYYTNGQELAERHWINEELKNEKCWDSKGNPKPIDFLKSIKSVEPTQ
jgi:hypothetical protein